MAATLRTQLDASLPPSAESVGRLVRKFETLQTHLSTERALPADRVARLELVSKKFSELEQQLKVQDHKPNLEGWAERPRQERQQIVSTLGGLLTELTGLNGDELTQGKRHFTIFTVFLVLVVGCYFFLHTGSRRKEVKSQEIIEATTRLHAIELEINALKKVKAQNGTLDPTNLQKAVQAFRDTAVTLDLSAPALQLLGNVEAEVTKGEIFETQTFANLSKTVSAELESFRSVLRSDGWWRWVEIVFWAELGTLVGILFYMAGSLSEGYFLAQEIPMFWTEVFIAPIVVLSIFFLFNLTGITTISPQETSITGIVALAFIFGFSIRRTLGLLDTVKKRLFPEPAPASKSPDQ